MIRDTERWIILKFLTTAGPKSKQNNRNQSRSIILLETPPSHLQSSKYHIFKQKRYKHEGLPVLNPSFPKRLMDEGWRIEDEGRVKDEV